MGYYLFICDFLRYIYLIGALSVTIKIFRNFIKIDKKENIIQIKEESNSAKEKSKNQQWETFIDIIIKIVVFVLLICFVIWIMIFKRNKIISFLFILFTSLEKINEGYKYSEKLILTLRNPDINNPFSRVEKKIVLGFTGTFMYFVIYKIPEQLINFSVSIKSNYLSDLILLLILFFLSVLFIFVSGVFFFDFIELLFELLSIIDNVVFKKRLNKIFYYNELKFRNPYFKEYLSVNFVKKDHYNKIIKFFIASILILLDILYYLFYYGIRLLISIIYYLSILILRIRKNFSEINKWFLKKTDRAYTVFLFRISVILSLVGIVVYNRIDPLLKMSINSTALLEFISSSIIIPLVLSWILEFNKRKEKTNKMSFEHIKDGKVVKRIKRYKSTNY